jgi:hypothetical protein
MSRRGNVARLPLPPAVSGTIPKAGDDIKTLRDHLAQMTVILNQGLQSLQNRVNTVQQTGAKTPPTVTGLTVTGKQGLFHLTWNRVVHADGYVVMQASDSAMSNLIGRHPVPDGEACTFQIPVGNVAFTSSFQVYAYQGQKYSEPSNIVTATTAGYGSAEAAPANPPFAPRHPKIAPVRSGPNL